MKLECAVFAMQYEWQEEPSYSIFPRAEGTINEEYIKAMAAQEWVYIGSLDVEIEELSPGQFRARQVEGLKVKKEALRETFLKESQSVQERIENLLAIEGH